MITAPNHHNTRVGLHLHLHPPPPSAAAATTCSESTSHLTREAGALARPRAAHGVAAGAAAAHHLPPQLPLRSSALFRETCVRMR